MVRDLLIAPFLGNERHIQSLEDRMVNGSVGFFDPIQKLKLNTGLSEKVKQQKDFDSKRRLPSFWRAHIKIYPNQRCFAVSISIHTVICWPSSGALRPSQTYLLTIYIVTQLEATINEFEHNAHSLIEGVATMSLKPNMTFSCWPHNVPSVIAGLTMCTIFL